MCVCSLGYPAGNAHASYCHPWPVWLYPILPHYITNGTTFEKGGGRRREVIEHKMCFDFLYTFCPKNFSFIEELGEKITKKLYRSSYKVAVILVSFLIKLEFSQ